MEAVGISVRLGRKTILRDLSFAACPGHLTAIAGPNGSGKTTLLRTLTADVRHSGTVTINGQRVSDMKPWELAAIRGVLAQATRIAFPFTVIEVVGLGLAAGTAAGNASLPLHALERVDLAGYANRFYHELSGGEQQRVQLARVLAQVWDPVAQDGPRWLLLDEPVSSLDIGHQLLVMELARDFARSGGGVIAVMHDLNLTAMFADRVAIMRDGRIMDIGAPKDVMTDHVLSSAYGCRLRVNATPSSDSPFLLPQVATVDSGQ
ncbi:heme ABC transporter ATP-binding protein [Tropicimonas marinistellae]|uniref:heme ABC transporter ATP-binding protein n=1 Tax=Tropicimonas marinistellae TaxID=1739787 RepID=UPI000834D247|nr:heme ABC transporter ATP-binding protein [Tropicimonas marinistellae]